MRRIALPIAICLATYGCAAAEDSAPADTSTQPTTGGSTTATGGTAASTGGSMSGTPNGGTAPSGAAGTAALGGAGTGGTAGSAGTSTTAGGPGTAGSNASAGTAGTGGTPPTSGTCGTTAAATGTPLLIDDFEDGNADITAIDGRAGGWYLSTDLTGTVTPSPGATMPEVGGMPGKAVHIKGSGLTGWGASLAAAVANPITGCYDAAKFTGITVMLKGTGSVWVSVLTAAVRGAPTDMRNHYKKMVTLTADWTPVTINFSELTQPGGWGVLVPFDATKIYGIDFGPAMAATPAKTDFDFWVDNLSFK